MFARSLAFSGLIVLGGCGSYIGKGPPPEVMLTRPVSLEISVAGDQRNDLEDAVKWISRDSKSVRRVNSGADAIVQLSGKLVQEKAILAGTDSTWRLDVVARRDGVEVVRDAKKFTINGLNSNVPYEVEKLISDSVVWALERCANGVNGVNVASENARAVENPPAAVESATEVSDTPPLDDEPASARRKRKHR